MGQFELPCPGCQRRLRLQDQHRGRTVRCPSCGKMFQLAERASPASDAASPGAGAGATAAGRSISPQPGNSPQPGKLQPPAAPQQPAGSPSQRARGQHPVEKQPAEKQPVQHPPASAGKSAASTGGRRPNRSTDLSAAAGAGAIASSAGARPRKRRQPEPAADDLWNADGDDPWTSDGAAIESDWQGGSAPRRARHKRSSGASSGRLLKVLLILLLCSAGLGAAGGMVFLAARMLPGLLGNVVDLTYMPEDLQGFVCVRPARLLATPLMQSLVRRHPQMQATLAGTNGRLSLAPGDIDTTIVGFWGQTGSGPGGAGFSPATAFGGTGASANSLIVVRLNRDVDPTSLNLQPAGEHQGTPLYASVGHTVWQPSPRILVLGAAAAVTAAIDRGGRQLRFARFDFASSDGEVVIVGVGRPTGQSSASVPGAAMPGLGAVARLGNSINSRARGVSMNVHVLTQVDVTAGFLCDDSQAAEALHQDLDRALADAKRDLQNVQSIPGLQEFMTSLQSVVNSLTTSRSGSRVQLRGSVSQAVIDSLPTPTDSAAPSSPPPPLSSQSPSSL